MLANAAAAARIDASHRPQPQNCSAKPYKPENCTARAALRQATTSPASAQQNARPAHALVVADHHRHQSAFQMPAPPVRRARVMFAPLAARPLDRSRNGAIIAATETAASKRNYTSSRHTYYATVDLPVAAVYADGGAHAAAAKRAVHKARNATINDLIHRCGATDPTLCMMASSSSTPRQDRPASSSTATAAGIRRRSRCVGRV